SLDATMIISKAFYDKCSATYQKVIDEFEQKITDIQSQDGINEKAKAAQLEYIFVEYAQTYYIPMEYWLHFYTFHLTRYNKRVEDSGCSEVLIYFRRDFYEKHWFNCSKFIFALSYGFLDFYEYASEEIEISFPHSHLVELFDFYEKYLSSPPPKEVVKRYEAMKELYSKIIAAEDDVEKWFKLLLEVGINDFVTHVTEYRIVKNLNDEKLWKIYIGYLKDVNPKKMLAWYSKYCRFFMDDLEMKEKYQNEMKNYGGSMKLPWRNLFEFEKALVQNENNTVTEKYGDTVNSEFNEVVQNDENQDVQNAVATSQSSNSDIKFRPLKDICAEFRDSSISQYFSLPIMYYIRENADHMVLRKLFHSCKYFFLKKSTPICYAFYCFCRPEYQSGTTFDNEKLQCVNEACKPEVLKNLYITTVFYFWNYKLPTNYLSREIVPRIFRCDAKYVELIFQNLSFAELLFFIGHGNVVDLRLIHCEIKDVDGSVVVLEKIMEHLPNVKYIKLHPVTCGENTGHALANLKFNEKIFEMCFGLVGKRFDAVQFLNFCVTNRAEQQFHLEMQFNLNNFGEEFVQEIKTLMEGYKKSCENTLIYIGSNFDEYLDL
uniref:Uncharacterized protein n=1 Tax=Panagrolaimus sp. ES5 TaxID=591445 RepID=A0AC34F2W6_9BILA